MCVPWDKAKAMQRPLPNDALMIVARGEANEDQRLLNPNPGR